MASIHWRTDRTVRQLLLEQFSHFNVFQLLRLLQWPNAAGSLDQELRLRFRADLSAAFAGHEFSRVRSKWIPAHGQQAGYEVIEIKTANYCIASSLGPLPEPFTEWVRDLKRARAPAMADFLDIFNQRLNLIRYQLKARHTLGLNQLPPAETEHAAQLSAMMGLGLPQLRAQIDLPQRSLLGLAGLLANCRKSAATIAQVLSLYIGVKVELEELVGAWQAIEDDEQIGLGRRNQRLGQQALLGKKVWDQSARIRLIVAPLNYARFCQLLPPSPGSNLKEPGNRSYVGLLGLLRLLINGMHDCEVHLQLLESSVPPSQLSGNPAPRASDAYHGLRLGQTAWLAGSRQALARQISFIIPAFASLEQA